MSIFLYNFTYIFFIWNVIHQIFNFIFLRNIWTIQWKTFTQIYSTGVDRVPTVVSGAFYYRLDVCTGLCKLLFQTQFLSNYPTIILLYLYNNIPQVNNKCIISCNHLTKLLMWSRHYVEIRKGRRCNHIWVIAYVQ